MSRYRSKAGADKTVGGPIAEAVQPCACVGARRAFVRIHGIPRHVFTAVTLLAILAFPALAGEMSGTQSVPGVARLWAFSSGGTGTQAMAACEGARWWLLPTLVLFSAAVRVVVPRMALMNSTALAIPLVREGFSPFESCQ